jgi:hypothetical protein
MRKAGSQAVSPSRAKPRTSSTLIRLGNMTRKGSKQPIKYARLGSAAARYFQAKASPA